MKISWRAFLSAAIGAALGLGGFYAYAQVVHSTTGPVPSTGPFGIVVASCGADSLSPNAYGILQVNESGQLCINATVTATASFAVVTSVATDHSGTITTGGTSQAAISSNGSRKGYLIQNFGCGSNANGNIYVGIGVAASTSNEQSLLLPPCGQIMILGASVNTDAINVTGDNTGAKFVAKEFN